MLQNNLMVKKILIFGAGSIGAHHIYAGRSLGCDVYFTDINSEQVAYLKNNLYPSRYKKWDEKIKFIPYNEITKLKDYFNLVILGVPPQYHLDLVKFCFKYLKFKKILVEKPLCVFNQDFKSLNKMNNKNKIFCGFNHSVSKSILKLFNLIKNSKIGKVNSVVINWKENFDYILKAHPWIKNFKDTYLSKLKNGGGGIQEYSHAIHLAVLFKNIIFKGKFNMKKKILLIKKKNEFYDFKSDIFFKNKKKKISIYIDTISKKVKKSIQINGSEGSILWLRELEKKKETIFIYNSKIIKINFKINRKDDFINEHKNLYINDNKKIIKNLNLKNSIKTMLCINRLLKNV